MTRSWLLVLCLLGAAALRADGKPTDAAANWQTVTLFDWLYSGEQPYEALKQAAQASGDQGWVAQRLLQGQKVPQASARELAWKLADDQALDPKLRAQLKALFADETQQIGLSGQDAVAQKAAQMDDTLVLASQKLDALEASMAKNTYGKGSSTGVNLNLYTGYRVTDPAGAIQGQNFSVGAGGMEAALAGSLGKVNYNFSIGAEYYYNNLNNGFPQGSGPSETRADDTETYAGNLDGGVSLEFPLGDQGGLDVSLGEVQNVELSPLLFSGIFPSNRDAFFVDVMAPYRAPKVIKTMDLDYPAATFFFRGLYVVKEGSVWYWPFDSTQFVYTPFDQDYYYSWDAKLYIWALRLEEDLNARGDWFDGGEVYGIAQGTSNNNFQINGLNYMSNPAGIIFDVPGNRDPLIFTQATQSYGLGANLRGSSGAVVHLDGAVSSYTWGPWPDDNNISQTYSGTAFIATVAQPVGPFSFALQAGQASPYFLSSPRVENRIQAGATQDSIGNVYGTNGVDLGVDLAEDFSGPGPVPTAPPAVSWISMMNQPDVLTNNNNQLALKGAWHGSWVSVGAYDGAQMQINPTDAFVWTTPYIEGNQDDGYGWFRVFGNTFASGSQVAPGTAPAAANGNGLNNQLQFNLPTAASANYGKGQSMKVNWQQMAQYGNYETEFITLLSQNGVGDQNLMANTAKSLNYAGTNLLFDFGALMNLTLPLQLTIIGEDRDLDTAPGLPGSAGTDLFNQIFEVADLNWGVSDTVTLLGTAGLENWKSVQSLFPVNMQITEFGVGADLNEDPYVTGLVFNLRASVMTFQDLNIASRDLSLITVSLGSTLSY